MSLRNGKVLVTGGAGFVGTNLVKRLVKEHSEVHVIDNFSTGKQSNRIIGATYYDIDICNVHDLSVMQPDLVYHLAAKARIQPSWNNEAEYYRVNAMGTMRIAEWCAHNAVPLIYAGSSSKWDGDTNPYTWSKSEGERILARLAGFHPKFQYVVARFYNVYGPHQLEGFEYSTLIGRWIHNIKNDRTCEIFGDGEKRRDFTHVDDIVDGLIALRSNSHRWNMSLIESRAFDFGRGKDFSINEVAEMFSIKPEYHPDKPGEADVTHRKGHDAKRLLNWVPTRDLGPYIKNILITLNQNARRVKI